MLFQLTRDNYIFICQKKKNETLFEVFFNEQLEVFLSIEKLNLFC